MSCSRFRSVGDVMVEGNTFFGTWAASTQVVSKVAIGHQLHHEKVWLVFSHQTVTDHAECINEVTGVWQ